MVAGNACDSFVDHYNTICSAADPDTPYEDLKKSYHEKLRQFHPDKRPGSAGDLGSKITHALNEAWEILRDPAKREAYDILWRREKEAAMPPHLRADLFRRRGNDVYSKARQLAKAEASLVAIQESVKLYKQAIEYYSKAISCAPSDHRCYSNRSLCYVAVEDWARARSDAETCTKLRPDFMKGWFLLTKSLSHLGLAADAQRELQNGLIAIPGSKELMELETDLQMDRLSESSLNRSGSRSVSPVHTPPASNGPTPPPSRPVSATYLPKTASQTYAGHSSRSPGPSVRGSYTPPRGGRSPQIPNLDGSMTCGTGNFGMPTPTFADGGAAGLRSARSAYSPGPSSVAAGVGFAQTYGGPPPVSVSRSPGQSSRSPGPLGRGTPGPDLANGRGESPALRKSSSLRRLAESSYRSPSKH